MIKWIQNLILTVNLVLKDLNTKKPAKESHGMRKTYKIMDELKTKHRSKYTDIQYRVWAELDMIF